MSTIADAFVALFTGPPDPPKPPPQPTVPTEDNQRAELEAAASAEKKKRRQANNIFAGANTGPLVESTQRQRTVLNG